MPGKTKNRLSLGHNPLDVNALRGFLQSMIASAIRDSKDPWRQRLGVNNLISCRERGLLSA